MLIRAATGLHAALSFFTTVPVPPVAADRDGIRRALLALPWLGLALGAVSAASSLLTLGAGAGQTLASTVGVVALISLTGAMHLDGLADTADGLGSRKPRDEALVVMRQSDIGPMGVSTLVVVLLLEVSALASPGLTGLALPGAFLVLPAVGRVVVLAGTTPRVPAARPDGFGALFQGATSPRACWLSALMILGVASAVGWAVAALPGVVAFGTATVAAWLASRLWRRHLVRRLGGLTGDTLGSMIELAHVTFALTLALLLAALP